MSNAPDQERLFSLEPSCIALCALPSAVLWPLPCTLPSTDDGAHGARPQGICIIYTDFNIRSSQALQLGVPGPGGGDGGGPHAIVSRLVDELFFGEEKTTAQKQLPQASLKHKKT